MKLKRRFANFVSVDESDRTEHVFETEEEFRKIDWIKNLLECKGFIRFSASISKYPKLSVVLMAEWDSGEHFAIGFLDEHPSWLPLWTK